MEFCKWKGNPADPCFLYKWTNKKLTVFSLWVDDCLISGPKDLVNQEASKFMKLFDCTVEDNVTEYVGCKVDRDKKGFKLTQPVKIKKLIDKFGYGKRKGKPPNTPAVPNSVLANEAMGDKEASEKEKAKFGSVTGMLIHLVRYSRPDVINAVCECTKFVKNTTKKCMLHLERLAEFLIGTKNRGYHIKPEGAGTWDGTQNFLF